MGRRRRRPTLAAEAFVGLFVGDEHPPGIPTPCFAFPLCEAEHPNPNLKLFGYLMHPNFELFCNNYLGCHVYIHIALLCPPLPMD